MRTLTRCSYLSKRAFTELVKDNEIVYTNENQIYTATDPTFHAVARLIRKFCNETHIVDLHEYTLYSSCEPCFMCCGAMVWKLQNHATAVKQRFRKCSTTRFSRSLSNV
ncbi:deaminase [Desulfosporosinus acididurans]|uniref:deaminase n=1 Tax=Desulfosporosinus acididurans TaxID=476652 RepID=UPI001FA6EDF3|nr:deaminase [Desulfosporosinus acididurans]